MVTSSWGPYPPAALPCSNGGSISAFHQILAGSTYSPSPGLGQLTSLLLLSFVCLSSFFVFLMCLLFYLVIYLFFPCLSFILFHVYVFALSPHPAVGSGCTFLGCLIQSSTWVTRLPLPPASLTLLQCFCLASCTCWEPVTNHIFPM